MDHFEVLNNHGYDQFLWFTKYGTFNHFMNNIDSKEINLIAEVCLNNKVSYDMHYDIIALHSDTRLSPVALAELAFAKKRKSYY